MNDNELSRLFHTGTAPERDAAFAQQTSYQIRRHQQISTLLTVVRILGVTMLVVGLFVVTQLYQAMFGVSGVAASVSLTSIALPLVAAATGSLLTVLRRRKR
jgi:hypothetical protein